MLSPKQIGTICFAFFFLIFPNFASAENIPTTNPGCTTTVLGAQNIANGNAALEPDFSANTINTTWYSNGTQLTGNNIPATCTYDAALTPPTPEDRPGYVFAGWRLKPPACEIPSSLASTTSSAYFAKELDGVRTGTYGGVTAATYGLTEPGQWGISCSNGDMVVGESLCSQTNGTLGTSGIPDTSGGQYCWCRATGYMVNGAEQCSFASSSWVYRDNARSEILCVRQCASQCALRVRGNQDFWAAVFAGNIAQ